MFADEFKHEVGRYLKRKAEVLLESQAKIAAANYGHLKSGVWKFLMVALSKQMIRTMEDTFHTIKH